MAACNIRLRDLSLLVGQNSIDGKWVEVETQKRFDVTSEQTAAPLYGDVVPHSQPSFRVSVLREPIGVCGLITPWNFPAAMITRKLGPALAAGCTVIIKTAGETPFTANALIKLGERAGIPAGVVNSVTALASTPGIGEALCSSNVVRKIFFTGSTRVGKFLMQQSSSS